MKMKAEAFQKFYNLLKTTTRGQCKGSFCFGEDRCANGLLYTDLLGVTPVNGFLSETPLSPYLEAGRQLAIDFFGSDDKGPYFEYAYKWMRDMAKLNNEGKSFSEIADWLAANVEFIEEEKLAVLDTEEVSQDVK